MAYEIDGAKEHAFKTDFDAMLGQYGALHENIKSARVHHITGYGLFHRKYFSTQLVLLTCTSLKLLSSVATSIELTNVYIRAHLVNKKNM